MITQDQRMLRCLTQLECFAPTDLPVLLEGESGTGKELVARAIHRLSARRHQSWMAVNCGAIPSQLQESELFGHVRGAYTGATMDKPGLFEAAHEGTLFLDEVGEMDPMAQVKLLRVLEDGELRRLGEVRTRRVDVRIVAATNTAVDAAVEEGRFRKDLLFRLGAVRVLLPTLRERPGDILPLAQHFVRKASGEAVTFTPAARMALLSHSWPGNIRELKFVIERAIALWRRTRATEICRELLFPQEEAEDASHPLSDIVAQVSLDALPEGCSLDSFLGRVERGLIECALARAGGNRTLAAKALGGLSRTTLIGKMKRLGLFTPLQAAAPRAQS
jgi:transcriptional regulator with PAS, ATPase and Fis domain